MHLLLEATTDVEILKEENTSSGRNYFIQGIFIQGDIRNKNGRRYPMRVLGPAIARYNATMIQENRSLGELGHPTVPNVNLERASHIVQSLTFQGKDVYGKAKILDTPLGKVAKNLIDEKVKLGVSSRGLGSLKVTTEQIKEVQDDFVLSAIDIVSDPSGPEAFVQGILEGKEWVNVDGVWQELCPSGGIEEAQQNIKSWNRNHEQRALRLFEQFMRKLSGL